VFFVLIGSGGYSAFFAGLKTGNLKVGANQLGSLQKKQQPVYRSSEVGFAFIFSFFRSGIK